MRMKITIWNCKIHRRKIMDNNVEELLKALEKVNSLMTDENIERATTEQLLRYNELINKIKARLIELV
jgi:hypothetical protein